MRPSILAGLKLASPVLIGSGPPTSKLEFLKHAEKCGAGGASLKLTFKTVPFRGQLRSYSLPGRVLVFPIDKRLDLEEGVDLARKARNETSLVLFSNLGAVGANIREWIEIADAFEKAGCHAHELNFCCPNLDITSLDKRTEEANHGGSMISQNADSCYDITRAVKEASGIPVFCKIVPNVSDIETIVRACQAGGADGIHIVGNPTWGLPPINLECDGKPAIELLEGASYGAANGSICKYSTYKVVAQVARAVNIPVIASGGLDDWRDCASAIMWGASATAVCSAPMWFGFEVVRHMVDDLDAYMSRKGYQSVEEIRGLSLQYLTTPDKLVIKEGTSVIDADKCTNCGRCTKPCHCDAITMIDEKAQVEAERCIGCGVCVNLCPVGAIQLKPEQD